MPTHERFTFRSGAELAEKAASLGLDLPFDTEIRPLLESFSVGSRTLRNRLAVLPMEGCDARADGSPGELTYRRYIRYASGGSSLIWFEATSVDPEGRSNPHQLWLHPESLEGFRALVQRCRKAASEAFGGSPHLICILQLTHSGRYARPQGTPRPQVAVFDPSLDGEPQNVRVLTDEELDRLQDRYVGAARLARQAGFDAVDVKACHGYLLHELLGARERSSSRYGGSFANRSRFLRETLERIRSEVPALDLAVRLSATEAFAPSSGYGISRDEHRPPKLKELFQLVRMVRSLGCRIISVTAGNPYIQPHVVRPFDRPLPGEPLPPEHPLESVVRLITLAKRVQTAFPEMTVVGAGYSWLRQYIPHVAAAVLRSGGASLIGLGRSSLAYPNAPKDLMESQKLSPSEVCLTCSRCTELMRVGLPVGCAVRDRSVYGHLYQKIDRRRACP